jgi:DNA-binding NarL/FixJ family response regulator
MEPRCGGGRRPSQEYLLSRCLGVRPKTVRNHVSNVLTKLAVADRTEAVLKAREAGLT